jgi:hypothetical protein
MKKSIAMLIKMIIGMFANLNGTSFVGIREYEAKTSGETANHVVIANASYGNAVKHDLFALRSAVYSDLEAIVLLCLGKGIETTVTTVNDLVNKLATSFENNQNTETASKGSLAQKDAYIQISDCIKYNPTTELIYIHASAHSKTVLVDGIHKHVNHGVNTLIQNEIKYYFKFKTLKYRNFILHPSQLSGVRINGNTVELV